MVLSDSCKEYGGCLHFEGGITFDYHASYYEQYNSCKVDVDSGRSAIQYILENYDFKRIWLPVYNCPLVAKRISAVSNIEIKWYNLKNDFMPDVEKSDFLDKDVLLWVNYCGVMPRHTIDKVVGLQGQYGIRVIIDNIPAYFSQPCRDAINIYSCRKFLGVPDGGHIIADDLVKKELPVYSTAKNYLYLLKAIETGSNSVYGDYQESERRFSESMVAFGMPKLTQRMLLHVDYDSIIAKRKENFDYLHSLLKEYNGIDVDFTSETASVYPYLTKNIKMRDALLNEHIYISRFWKHVLSNKLSNEFERGLAEYLIPLPIDQRYDIGDMEYIASTVMKFEEENKGAR